MTIEQDMKDFNRIDRTTPVATVKKFKLMKRFHHLMPENAKEFSAQQVAETIIQKLAFAEDEA